MTMQWQRFSNPMSRTTETRDEIVDGIARLLWTDAWATREEEAGRSHGGENLWEIAPTPPRHADRAAKKVATRIEELNGLSLDGLWAVAIVADGGLRATGTRAQRNDPEAFGSDLGMMVLGHGVSWYDDHAKFIVPTTGGEMKLPSIEYDASGNYSGV